MSGVLNEVYKIPKYIPLLTEKFKLEYFASVMRYRLPVFEAKAKINVLEPSDVIKRPKSTDFNTKRFRHLVLSVA